MFQLIVYCQMFVYFSLINHLEDSDTEIAQSNEAMMFGMKIKNLNVSAIYLLSAVCLHFYRDHSEASDTENSQSKDVNNDPLLKY